MCRFIILFIVAIVLFEQVKHSTSLSRQKRCIVIQKQSGTHGDSTEGEDDDYQDKNKPERNNDKWNTRHNLRDAEVLAPELLKYQVGRNKKINDLVRLRNKLKGHVRV